MPSSTCKKWLAENWNSTGCTACSIFSRGATSNVAVPRQSTRCQAMHCHYNNGIVSPTTPLGYDGRLVVQSESLIVSSRPAESAPCYAETGAASHSNQQPSPFASSVILALARSQASFINYGSPCHLAGRA